MEPGLNPEVEVIEPARPGRRRRFTAEEKRRIVEETAVPGQSVSSVSRRYGVSPSQVFKWRRLVEGDWSCPRRTRSEGSSVRGAKSPASVAAAAARTATITSPTITERRLTPLNRRAPTLGATLRGYRADTVRARLPPLPLPPVSELLSSPASCRAKEVPIRGLIGFGGPGWVSCCCSSEPAVAAGE